MQTAIPTRKHQSPAQREAMLRDYHQSQLTQKDFAAQAGISVSALRAWLRKAAAPAAVPVPAFVPVPNLLATAPVAAAYRLQWPGGLTLEIRAGFAAQELGALLQLLPGL